MRTIMDFGVGQGRVIHRMQGGGTRAISSQSNVFASVCEFDPNNGVRFHGDASLVVCGIAPGPGLVDVWVQINWDEDLSYELTILIADDV